MRHWHVPVLSFALGAVTGCVNLPLPETPGTPEVSAGATVAAEMIELTNQERERNGRRALVASPKLMEAARLHARQMAAHRQAAHTITGAQYPTMQSRLQAVGYAYLSAAENVAWNQRSAQEVVMTWMQSSGHRANILDPDLTEIGTAMATGAGGEPYWIQVFGRPR